MKVAGVTVHFVDEGVDSGPIVLQEAFELSLSSRHRGDRASEFHEVEHRLLPRAVRLIAAGRVSLDPDNPRLVRVESMAERGSRRPESVAPGEVRIRRALLSVSDKRGLVDFARGLAELGVEIVSTGGTARELAERGHRDAAGGGLHRLPGDPRRPREDAEPADLRGAARGALGRRPRARRSTSTGSSRSTWSA